MGIMGSLHYSLGMTSCRILNLSKSFITPTHNFTGKGAGSFLGGLTYGIVGARYAFRYFGITAGILGILFFICDFFWIRKVVARRLSESKTVDGVEGGREMQIMSSRRGSIFDANPLASMASMVSLDDTNEADEDEVAEKMIKDSGS